VGAPSVSVELTRISAGDTSDHRDGGGATSQIRRPRTRGGALAAINHGIIACPRWLATSLRRMVKDSALSREPDCREGTWSCAQNQRRGEPAIETELVRLDHFERQIASATFCVDHTDAVWIRLHLSRSPVSLVWQGQHWSIVTTIALVVGVIGSTSLRTSGHLQQKKSRNTWRILALAPARAHWSTQMGEVCLALAPALQGRVLPHRLIFFAGTVEHRGGIGNVIPGSRCRRSRAVSPIYLFGAGTKARNTNCR
jgi:hypothetical protein